MGDRTWRSRLSDFVWLWFGHWGFGGRPPPGCLLLIAGGAVAASVAIPLHLAARREQAAVSRLRAVGAGRGDVAAVVSELVGEGGLVGYRVVRLAGPGLALGAVPSNPADNRALLLLPDGRLVAREVDSAPFAAGDPPPEVPGDGWVPVPVEPAD